MESAAVSAVGSSAVTAQVPSTRRLAARSSSQPDTLTRPASSTSGSSHLTASAGTLASPQARILG